VSQVPALVTGVSVVSSNGLPVVGLRTAATLTDADIDTVLDAVPATAALPRTVVRLAGGLTNVNVKVTNPRGSMVARIATTDSALLAIDRVAEHANSLAAAASGAAPQVLDYSAEAGVLVVDWIEGRTFSAEDLRDGRHLARVAEVCRRLHSGPRFVNDFDMFEVQRGYLQVVTEHGFRLPSRYRDFMPQFERMRLAVAERAEPTVPCNNDLLAENFLDDGERLWLIDYEYSGNNDPCFELGNIWSESGLALEQLAELVTWYYGKPLRNKVARARLLGLASKYGWTLWAAIQDAASTLDFDFWSWGMEKYERAVAEFDGPEFDRLLETARGPD
jgi:thiamine kinase-like enzyme